jgi:1-acyl-sn-glycerol-3-phosphate acyltransferase
VAARLALRTAAGLLGLLGVAISGGVGLVLGRRKLLASLIRAWLRASLWLFGIEVVTIGPVPAPPGGGHLVAANHRTGFDVVVLLALVQARALAHAGVAGWPIVGALARAARTIFVERTGVGSRAAALRAIGAGLAAGDTVLVFPEGTTFAGDEVRKFSTGPFAAARGHHVLPVGLAAPAGTEFVEDSSLAYAWRMLRRPRTLMVVAFGDPYPCPDDGAQAALDARTRVEALVRQARRAHEDHGLT